jgi:hypothetical protein
MTMLSVIPQEFFDGMPVPPTVTLDGELLGALDETPAGPWLAELVAAVDRIAAKPKAKSKYGSTCEGRYT